MVIRGLIKFPWAFFGVAVFTKRALPCYTVVARLSFKRRATAAMLNSINKL